MLEADAQHDKIQLVMMGSGTVSFEVIALDGDLVPGVILLGDGEISGDNNPDGRVVARLDSFELEQAVYLISVWSVSGRGSYELRVIDGSVPVPEPGPLQLSETCQLTDAIIAANADTAVGGCPAGSGADTITLTSDITLSAELPPIESEITLEGASHAISGVNRYRIFFVGKNGDLTINGAKLTGGRARDGARHCIKDTAQSDEAGGAICNRGRLSIIDSVISDNSSNHNGGAIRSTGELYVANSQFVSNSADRGGAIYSIGELRIMTSEFHRNSAGSDGGAIYSSGRLTVANGEFTGNSSGWNGGAISSSGELIVSNGTFADNTAPRRGGAIHSTGIPRVTRSLFSGNSAAEAGGAMYLLHSSYENAYLADNAFSQNSPDNCFGMDCDHAPDDSVVLTPIAQEETREEGEAAASDPIIADWSCELADAITAANEDRVVRGCPAGDGADTIVLTVHVTLREALPPITSEITLEAGGYTISGNKSQRIFLVRESGRLTIKGAILTDGRADEETDDPRCDEGKYRERGPGGAICNRGYLSIIDSYIRDNSAGDHGGAIYSTGVLYIASSEFNSNSAERRGGAIYSVGELLIAESRFASNSAEGVGGAISSTGPLSVTEAVFVYNSGDRGGSAISSHGPLIVTNSIFRGNVEDAGTLDGGGTILSVGAANIVHSIFGGNSSSWNGGAISSQGELNVSHSEFNYNTTQGSGGAIDSTGVLKVTRSEFIGNATHSGGAIISEGALNVTGSHFSGNSGSGSGGAIFSLGVLSITNSEFGRNHAGDAGGVIFADGVLNVMHSEFHENAAAFGAALDTKGVLSVTASQFNGNLADQAGGAINQRYGIGLVESTTFGDNSPEDCHAVDCLSVPGGGRNMVSAAPEDAGAIGVGGACELADAIASANEDRAVGGCPAGDGADVIVLTGDILLRAELPRITSQIALEGRGHVISGDGRFRIFLVSESGDLSITETRLRNGAALDETGVAGCDTGGPFDDSCDPAQLCDEDNSDSRRWGGAICNRGRLTVVDSVFSNNSSISYIIGSEGGAIYNDGELQVADSIFRGNSAGIGGAIRSNRSERRAGAALSVTDSEFLGNSGHGGAIYVTHGNAEVLRSTFVAHGRTTCFGVDCAILPGYGRGSTSTALETVPEGAIEVNSNCTLADAITAANEDRIAGICRTGNGADTIALRADITLSEDLPRIESEITLIGARHTISGDRRHRIFVVNEVGDLTLRDVMLRDANTGYHARRAPCVADIDLSDTFGSAICSSGRVSIIDSAINDNLTATYGAIFSTGEMTIVNSAINRNRSLLHGGAIVNVGELSVIDSVLSGNSAKNDAGTILNAGHLNVTGSLLSDNTTELIGGAIYNTGVANITGSELSGNSASGASAIWNIGELIVSKSAITGNTGWSAISHDGVLALVQESTFADNSTSDCINVVCVSVPGGGRILASTALEETDTAPESDPVRPIYVNESCDLADAIIAANKDLAVRGCPAGNGADTIILSRNVTLAADLPWITTDMEFVGNGHSISGGSRHQIFYVVREIDVSIDHLALTDGSAAEGGAIRNFGRTTITNSTFADNSARDRGGAIINGGELNVHNTDFTGNSSGEQGGAIFNRTDAKLTVFNSVFEANNSEFGGAIGNNGKLYVKNSEFSGNIAEAYHLASGGALFSGVNSYDLISESVIIEDSEFVDNSAILGGAFLNYGSAEALIRNSSFSGNSAEKGGAVYQHSETNVPGVIGHVYQLGAGRMSISNSSIEGNRAEEGGGIYIEGHHTGTPFEEGRAFISMLDLQSSVVADNEGGDCVIEKLAELASESRDNVVKDGTCGGAAAPTTGASRAAREQEDSSTPTASAPEGPISVDESCSLADAITAANEDRAVGGCPAGNGADTIVLTGDIRLSEELPAISSEITLEGGGHTISGDDKFRIFLVGESGNMTIQYATLVDGNVREESAAMRCVEDQNASAMWGGTICNLGLLSITGGAIRNSTSQNGGAVYSQNELILTNVQFSGNSAAYGGAIFNWGELNVTNSEFRDNSGSVANAQGGAIYNFEGQLNIVRSNFTSNKAPVGGAIFSDGELSVSGSVFGNNGADGNGGAIASEGEFSVTGSVFEGNTAFRSGGAIVSTGEVSVSDSVFNSNSARGGGAIASGRKLSVTGSEFSGNAATSKGGAIFSFGELSVTDSEFSDNSADNTGGAIFQDGDNAQVADSVFSANSPEDCVGIECASIVSDS